MLALLRLGLLRGTKTEGHSALSGGPLAVSTQGDVSCPWETSEWRAALDAGSSHGQHLPAAAHGAARSRGAAQSCRQRFVARYGSGEKLPWGGGMSVMTSIPLLACSCPFKTHMTFSHQQKENYTSLGSGLKQSSAGGTKCI